MALGLTRHSRIATQECVPCCWDNCDNNNTKKIHFFTFDLFADHPQCVSGSRNDDYKASGVGGEMSISFSAESETIFSLSKSFLNPAHSITTEVKGHNNTWYGRSNTNNGGFSEWEKLDKTYSNDIMFRLTGIIDGKTVLLQGFCSCSLQFKDTEQIGAYYYIARGKNYYVTVTGLPSCFSNVTDSFSFYNELPILAPPPPLFITGRCQGEVFWNAGMWSYDLDVHAEAAVICNNGWPILPTYFYQAFDGVQKNISDPMFSVGEIVPNQNLAYVSTASSRIDLSFPMTINLNPFFFHYQSRIQGNYDGNYNGISYNGAYYDSNPTFAEVIATE